MDVQLRPLGPADVAAHNAGEDQATVRWLTGGYGTVESTTAHFDRLARHALTGRGVRGFGVFSGGHLAGYVECDPDIPDGLIAGDVNITYAVHPWARGRGVAVAAVELLCEHIQTHQIGTRPAIRVQPANLASVRVAQKCGFVHVRDFTSTTDRGPDGAPATLSLYLRRL